jgi:hypothetical protein
MFDEEAERSKLSALDLTDDVIEMILKKKRSKYEERCPPTQQGTPSPHAPPTASGIAPDPQPPTPPLPVPDPQPPAPTPYVSELREEEEPEQLRLQSQPGSAPIKKHFHLWHKKLYNAFI